MKVQIIYKKVTTRFGEAYVAKAESLDEYGTSGESFKQAKNRLINKLKLINVPKAIEEEIPEPETIEI